MNGYHNIQAPPSPASTAPSNGGDMNPNGGMIDPRWQRPLIVFSEIAPHGRNMFAHTATESFVVEVKTALQTLDRAVQSLDARLREIEEGLP